MDIFYKLCKIKDSPNKKYFYSYVYYDDNGEPQLYTFVCIQNVQNIQNSRSTPFNVRTGNSVQIDDNTIDLLKRKFKQLKSM